MLVLPEIVWEASLGIDAAWKGFRPSPIMKTMDIHDEAAPKDLVMASASGACAFDG